MEAAKANGFKNRDVEIWVRLKDGRGLNKREAVIANMRKAKPLEFSHCLTHLCCTQATVYQPQTR